MVIAPFALPIIIDVAFLVGPVAHSVGGFISPHKTWMAGPVLLRLGVGFSFVMIYLPSVAQSVHWLRDVYHFVSP